MESAQEALKRKIRRNQQGPFEESDGASAAGNPSQIADEKLADLTKRVTLPGLRNPLMRPLLVCALLGAIAEFFVRIPGMAFVGLFGAVAATAAYPLWGYWRGLHTIPSLRERLADNSYYLGFIITQISLLVGFGAPALMQAEIKAIDVLRFFGIAIGASMAGLIARTLIMQGGHSVDEHEEIVQSEVESLSREVSSLAGAVASNSRQIVSELQATLTAFQTSRTAIESNLAAWTASVSTSLKEYQNVMSQQVAVADRGVRIAGSAAERLEATANSGTETLGNTISTFSTSIDSLQKSLNSKIELAATAVLSNMTQLSAGTETATSAQKLTSTSLNQIAGDIQQAAQHVNRTLSALKVLGEFETKLQGLGAEIDRRVSSSIQTVGEATASTATFKTELDASITAFKSVLEDFRAELRNSGG